MRLMGLMGLRNNAGILGDEGINGDGGEVVDEGLDCGKLVVVEEGVERHVDLHTERACKAHELRNVLEAVACGSTGTEARSSDIDCVGTVADGLDAALKVARRGE